MNASVKVGRAGQVAIGLLVDRAFGDPRDAAHPVAWFGRVMTRVEDELYRDENVRGIAHAAIGTAIGLGAGFALRSTSVATAIAVGARGLEGHALGIRDALQAGDLDEARMRLPALVGRDAKTLDEKEICRATIESIAENTVDAVIAPAVWALFAGAPGALAYRALNTMDAMVGHHSTRYENYGWAAARLDDAANWIPARITALAVATVRPSAAADISKAVRKDAPGHPSPNAGVAEAAFAAALGIELGGTNQYGERTEIRARLGTGRSPGVDDIERAVELLRVIRDVIAAVLLATEVLRWAVRRGRSKRGS